MRSLSQWTVKCSDSIANAVKAVTALSLSFEWKTID